MILAISAAHALTSTHHATMHAVYEYLYYVPILAAAYWFGAPGGLVAAFTAAAAYFPHIRISWADNAPYAASQYGELIAFHLVGGVVGLLIARLRRSTEQARKTADALEARNRELVASHRQLDRAERLSALGELAAGLAHEVRTPITAIQGALDILASRAKGGTPEAEFTGVASRELTRLGALLEEFLAYARPRPPAVQPIRLSVVADQVTSLLLSEARQRAVTLSTEYMSEGAVIADPSQMTQVVLNVVLNAIQASPRGGQVHLVVRDSGSEAIVEVLDDGPGVPPESAERVFEPFFTTKPRGSGLGLAIVHRIVSAHGGTVTLAQREPAGAVATIQLPSGHRPPTSGGLHP